MRVVVTSTILADLTDRIGGDAIELTGLLNPGDDPHVYEPVPQDTVALEQADLILYNGYNLEPGLIRLMDGAGAQDRALAVGEVVTPLALEYEGQRQPDPHVWGDVENAIAMVNAIRDALIELAPDQESLFTENARQLTEQLTALDTWVEEQIATIPPAQRQLVTTHDAFQYYANAYGLEIAGTLIGISTEEQPSAQTISRLVGAIQATGVPTIFAETTINPALIQTVAAEAGVNLSPTPLYSDSIGAPGSDGDSYLKMIAANTCAIATGLRGSCTPFEE
ncbi:MAG TPA: zinc ABC transporter substrate-binding protein [Trichocoleus sp.]